MADDMLARCQGPSAWSVAAQVASGKAPSQHPPLANTHDAVEPGRTWNWRARQDGVRCDTAKPLTRLAEPGIPLTMERDAVS